jgi:hypothetical protein
MPITERSEVTNHEGVSVIKILSASDRSDFGRALRFAKVAFSIEKV